MGRCTWPLPRRGKHEGLCGEVAAEERVGYGAGERAGFPISPHAALSLEFLVRRELLCNLLKAKQPGAGL